MCVPRCAGRPAGQPLRGAVETGSRDRLEHARPRLLRFHAAMDLLRKACACARVARFVRLYLRGASGGLTSSRGLSHAFTTPCTQVRCTLYALCIQGVNCGTPRGAHSRRHRRRFPEFRHHSRPNHSSKSRSCTCLTSPPLRTCTNRRPSRAVQAQRCSPWIWRLPSLHKQRTHRLTR